MSQHHHPTHWIGVAAALSLALVAMEAAGQQSTTSPNVSPNAGAVFQGRPSMSGAQAGQGAQAGPAQGGIGLQGAQGTGLNLRRPPIIEGQAAPVSPTACADLPSTSVAAQECEAKTRP